MSTSFETHARTIGRDLASLTQEVLKEFHRELHEQARSAAVAKSPVGTGEMKRSWVSAPTGVESAIDRLQPTKVRNVAPHAMVIDTGRRRSKNAWRAKSRKGTPYIVQAGKMLGSEQAPGGVKYPVLRELAQDKDAIFARAKARVESKGTR